MAGTFCIGIGGGSGWQNDNSLQKKSTFGLLDYLRSAFLSKSEDSLISRIIWTWQLLPHIHTELLPYMIEQAISIGSLQYRSISD